MTSRRREEYNAHGIDPVDRLGSVLVTHDPRPVLDDALQFFKNEISTSWTREGDRPRFLFAGRAAGSDPPYAGPGQEWRELFEPSWRLRVRDGGNPRGVN